MFAFRRSYCSGGHKQVSGEIKIPIFMVGVPRSGTTLLYHRLGAHPEVAWISKTSRKFPRSVFMTRVVSCFHRDNRPTECSWIWSRYRRDADDSLAREDITPEAERFYRQVFSAHLRLRGASRFLSKYPRNALRMPYFQGMFSDALFLHLVRDGRAVVNSLLRCREKHGGQDRYWGVRPPGWQALLNKPPAESCARQWAMTVCAAQDAAGQLPQGQYLEVRYEDFVSDPRATLQQIGEWAGLQWTEDFLASLAEGIENRNPKWREQLTAEQIRQVNDAVGDTLGKLGYHA